MARRQITCITKPDAESSHEAITHVGGAGFYITRKQCADDIDGGVNSYFVKVGSDEADVTTYVREGVKYIRTKPDSTKRDNLLSLSKCT
jgi:hypothetical protein